MINWNKIKELTDKHGYMSGVDRMTERVEKTSEVFTPTDTVLKMLKLVPIETYRPGQTVIDPTCGDGQFLVPVKWLKVLHFGMSEEEALKDIYGVDIMRDNVDLCKRRLGGGNIIMADSLNPKNRLKEQTEEEYQFALKIFNVETTDLTNFM